MTTKETEPGPLGGLPGADQKLLVHAPLEVAIAEIRFGSDKNEILPEEALSFRAAADSQGMSFPRMETALQQQMQFDASSGLPPQVSVQAKGWQFVSADSRVQVTLMPQSLILQTSRYERWSTSMASVLETLLASAETLLHPTVTTRIGLRYIDKFVNTSVDEGAGWRGRIVDSLLGPVNHPVLGPLVTSAQQQIELRLDPTHGAVLRHGPFRDDSSGGSLSYLLDIDVFDTRSDRFTVNDVLVSAEQLNRTALTLFQSALTPSFLTSMQEGKS